MARPRRSTSAQAEQGLLLARALGGAQAALSLLALRLAEPAGFLEPGACARLSALPPAQLRRALAAEARALRLRTGGALPPWPLRPASSAESLRAAAALLGDAPPAPEALCFAAEALTSAALGRDARRAAGLYYTPPGIAEQVVALGLAHGGVARGVLPSVLDPCAGAGAFLAAAARALAERPLVAEAPSEAIAGAAAANISPGASSERARARRDAALSCAGADLDPFALRVARAALALCAGPLASAHALASLPLRRLDSLRRAPGASADFLVSNPPYGHLDDPRERALLARTLPGLRGGEIDRYAAFLLRSLALVREGGTVALLIPDTWMTNARAGALRAAVLADAEIAAVADLGKPFAAAKDTRVQALVLVRRAAQGAGSARRVSRSGPARISAEQRAGAAAPAASDFPGRDAFAARLEDSRLVALAPVAESELRARCAVGWQPYRSAAERALCAAMEAAAVPLGSVCEVGYGLRTGDNARHVERRAPRPGETALCGGEDVVPFALRLAQKRLVRETPQLRALALRQLGRERVCIQRIRTNSALPWARWLEAAPVPAELVCLDSLSTLACAPGDEDRLWALLGLVHSVALNRYHRLRTTDVNVKPSFLRELPVPRALVEEPARAAALSALCRERSVQAAADPPGRSRASAPEAEANALERRIDRAVYELYALPESLVEEAERGFWGRRFSLESSRLPHTAFAAMSDPPRKVASIGRTPSWPS